MSDIIEIDIISDIEIFTSEDQSISVDILTDELEIDLIVLGDKGLPGTSGAPGIKGDAGNPGPPVDTSNIILDGGFF